MDNFPDDSRHISENSRALKTSLLFFRGIIQFFEQYILSNQVIVMFSTSTLQKILERDFSNCEVNDGRQIYRFDLSLIKLDELQIRREKIAALFKQSHKLYPSILEVAKTSKKPTIYFATTTSYLCKKSFNIFWSYVVPTCQQQYYQRRILVQMINCWQNMTLLSKKYYTSTLGSRRERLKMYRSFFCCSRTRRRRKGGKKKS